MPQPRHSILRSIRFLGARATPLVLVLVLVLVLALAASACAETLTVVSWGGAYEAMQRQVFFEPFLAQARAKNTNMTLRVERYRGGLEALRAQLARGTPRWDVIDLTLSDNQQACALGLIAPIDHSALASAPDGTPADEDFLPGALERCAVATNVYSTVIAFDTRAFPVIRPQTIGALFDTVRFPGKRALEKRPIAILEWALRDYGVPRADLYPLLSTARGLKLAFERLSAIRDDILWWEDASEAAALLTRGEAVIASGYNGRFFSAAIEHGARVQTIWDDQIIEYSTWGIVTASAHRALAQRFVRFASTTEALARQTRYISYGPTRRSSMALIGTHDASGLDMRAYLPTYAPHLQEAIIKDYDWYANTQPRLARRFEQWLADDGSPTTERERATNSAVLQMPD